MQRIRLRPAVNWASRIRNETITPTNQASACRRSPSVPAAIDERQIGTDLVTGAAAAIDALLLDKGFTGSRFAAEMASAGIEVIIPPTRAQHHAHDPAAADREAPQPGRDLL
jgi:hypothetical protein